MDFSIELMKNEYAEQIANWSYDKPYEIYNMGGNKEDINELMNGSYYAVLDNKNLLIGYYCFGESAQVPIGKQYGSYADSEFIDVGLGMRPDLCGKGKGYSFLRKELEFASEKFLNRKFRLTVAGFNERAINLYEKIGFKKVMSFERINVENKVVFQTMELFL